jgi:thioredoxin 1
MASPRITNLEGDAAFDSAVKSSVVTVVDFWAPWCGPCKAIAPVLDQIADELGDAVQITKVDVDKDANQPLAQKFGVQNIPTILFFKNGVVVDKIVGSRPKADLVATIKKHG